MPLRMRPRQTSRAAVTGSPNQRMPPSTVPTAPMPVHTAYAVPMGRLRAASPSRTTLMMRAARVPSVGPRRVKPSGP